MAKKIKYSANFKRNYMAVFALTLFCLMVATELVLALSIPTFIQKEDAFADEIRKRELIMLFDQARNECKNIPENNETIRMEKKLLEDTLDYLAAYLRNEADRLTPEDVEQLEPLVIQLHRIAARLKSGKTYSQESRLDSSAFINNLIQQHTGR